MESKRDISYMGYQEMIADINTALEKTSEVMTQLELTDQAQQARDVSARLKSHVFSVGIMGEFKRGKSTVINALLGEKIAPADVVPASATLNRVTYGLTPKATILYKDGRRESVPVDRIADYVTKITEESAATAALVDQAIVEYPCQFCKNNVEIIDTPGLNDDERMDAISEAVIPELDAVVMVLSADSPFSKSEAEFVRNKLMTSDVTRMIVLVNRIDTIFDEDDRIRVLQSIKEKIIREILDRTAAIHGTDSQLYQDTKSKLAELQLYPISAIQALQGRIKGKPELVSQSGILAFEDRLRRLLTQERGALEIMRVSSVIAKLLQEGQSAITLRINALEMDSEEFLKTKQDAEEEIVILRNSKAEEKERLRKAGGQIKDRMDTLVLEKYEALEARLANYVEQYPIDIQRMDSEDFAKEVQAGMEREVSNALSEYAEQINVFLQEQLGDERLRLQQYMGDLSNSIMMMNNKMKAGDGLITASVIGADALSNLVAVAFTGALNVAGFGLMGLGGMIEGFRNHGWKGAAVGAGGGFVASNLAALGLFAMVGTVPFIPFALITGIAGTMGGKLVTSLLWKKDKQKRKVEEFRSELRKTSMETVGVLRDQRFLESWAQKQVDDQVDSLLEHVEQESEALISSTEITLKSIAADIAAAEKNREQKTELYNRLKNKLNDVSETLIPIIEMVSSVDAQTV